MNGPFLDEKHWNWELRLSCTYDRHKNGIKPDVSQGFKIIFQYSAFVMLYSHRMKLTLYKKRASMLVAILLRNING